MEPDGKVRLGCSGVSHAFVSGGKNVLEEVSLEVARSEFVAIVGASGCGKTTLLRILAGLVWPERGSVYLGDKDVRGVTAHGRAIVFQGDRLYPWMSALDNVLFGLRIRGAERGEALRRTRAALELVGLTDWAHAYPAELSGGMRQRVNVARALVLEPAFLLMDEPFAALDAQTREIMQRELLRILANTSAGVVFVTHQIEEALYLADRVVVMGSRPGRIRDQIRVPLGRPRSLESKRDPALQEMHLRIWREIEADVVASVVPSRRDA